MSDKIETGVCKREREREREEKVLNQLTVKYDHGVMFECIQSEPSFGILLSYIYLILARPLKKYPTVTSSIIKHNVRLLLSRRTYNTLLKTTN